MDMLCDIKKDKRFPLIIVFGGLYGNIGHNIYEFKSFLQSNFDIHFIFVKDRSQSWYTNGVYGVGNNIDEVVRHLSNKIKKIKYTKIITTGMSMGGYASLLFGKLLNAENIISFSPQIFIDDKSRKKYKDFRYNKEISKIINLKKKKYKNLLLEDFSSVKSNILLVVPENTKIDILHVNLFNKKNKSSRILVIKNQTHTSLMKYLRDNDNYLYRIFKKSI